MTTIISATELKNKVSEVLNRVYFSREEFVVERYGKPLVKIIPVDGKKKKK